MHGSTRRFSRSLPLQALLPRASWPPGRCRRRRARRALAVTGAASRGARDAAAATGALRRAGEGSREEENAAGGGARGRKIPICSPDHSAACREERRLSCRLRAAAAAATARRLAAPSSPSEPTPTHGQTPHPLLPLSLLSRCLLLPNRERKGRGREKPRRLGGLAISDRGAEKGGEWGRRGELEGAPGPGPESWDNFRARVFLHGSLGARG